MKRTNRIMSMLLAVIMVVCMLPVSVFAADAATIENNGVIRYSETKAEVSFYPTSYDSQLDWQYYYIVTEQDAEMTADDVKNGGTAHEFDEEVSVATFDVTNLASGVSYIHIVLVQKDNAQQVSNVLTLEIPEYVPLTITPSAEGYELESGNTLTVVVGTTVTFTTSESGCGMEYKENTTVGPELVGSEGYSRTATFSELGTYTIVASINYKTAECKVVVVPEIHQHSYPTGWLNDESDHWKQCPCGEIGDKAAHSGPAATATTPQTCTVCGYEMAPAAGHTLTLNYNNSQYGISINPDSKTVPGLATGTVVDLSEQWPTTEQMTVPVGNRIYYFHGFEQIIDGDNDVWPTVTVNSNLTLNARWTTTELVTVTFEMNGGNMPYDKTRTTIHDMVDMMNSWHIPVRSGYNFVGWSLADDGTADGGSAEISEDCTLYAVWQSGSDEPPATDVPVNIGGNYDAILRDGMVIVRGEDPISGTLDLGKTDAEAIQFPYASVEKSAVERTEATILFPGGPSATLTGPAWAAAKDALKVGENLQISVEDVCAEVLPDSLTEKEPFEDDDGITRYSVFMTEGIFTYDELLKFGVFGGADESISWDDMKLLYRHMTTEDLRKLYHRFSGGSLDLEPFVDWLTEMIARDGAVVNLDTRQLDESGIRSKLEEVGYTGGGFTLGLLRQADLNMEQLEYIIDAMQEIIAAWGPGDENLILAWAEETIARKQGNKDAPTYVQVTGTPDGENPYFVAAVDVNMFAVRADGTTVPVAIRADRSDAVAWSTNISLASFEEFIAMLGDATAEDVVSNIKAYKVLENNTLEARGIKVIQNADGTLTLSALSDGNSTYVFLLEPEQADVDDTPTTPEAPNNPQTGDNSHMWLWFGLMLASGFALAITWAFGRRRRTS